MNETPFYNLKDKVGENRKLIDEAVTGFEAQVASMEVEIERSNRSLWITSGIVLLVVLGGFGYLVFMLRKAQTKS